MVELATAARAILDGGVVALPFERLFGLAADALDAEAVARVAAIKGRPARAVGSRPIAVLLPSREQVSRVAESFPSSAVDLADRYWPGPLTILVEARPDLPAPLVSASGLVGVRLAGPCPASELARLVDRPLTATSANRPGEDDVLDAVDLVGLEGVDVVMEGAVPGPPGSTVVDCSGQRPLVLRAGYLKIEGEG